MTDDCDKRVARNASKILLDKYEGVFISDLKQIFTNVRYTCDLNADCLAVYTTGLQLVYNWFATFQRCIYSQSTAKTPCTGHTSNTLFIET